MAIEMVGEFYDRVNEIKFFNDKASTLQSGEMIVLYGRRRLGKTSLIEKFLENSRKKAKTLYLFINIQGEQELKQSISRDALEQWKETITIENWRDFFQYLNKTSKDGKTILVIDEFQRLKAIAPGFITELQHQWDSTLKKNKIMLVLVGSSIGMMKRIAISPHGALYGRKTGQIQLKPFRYVDFREALPNKSEEKKIEWYSVFGGTPYYIELAKKHGKLEDAILKEILAKGATLREEPKNLLEFELKVTARYNSILSNISKGKCTIKEISDAMAIKRTTLPQYINSLQELLGLIERRQPLFGKKNLGRYDLSDNFFKFWYSFILPHFSSIELGNTQPPLEDIRQNLPGHAGRCAEKIVKELFTLYNGSEIKGVKLDFEQIGAWWDRQGNEIDLVIDSRDELLLGEVKWRNKPIEITVLESLEKKAKLIHRGGKRRFALVSKSGFDKNCLAKAKQLNCLTLDLKEITKLFDQYPQRQN